jgi:hypothetical protein
MIKSGNAYLSNARYRVWCNGEEVTSKCWRFFSIFGLGYVDCYVEDEGGHKYFDRVLGRFSSRSPVTRCSKSGPDRVIKRRYGFITCEQY